MHLNITMDTTELAERIYYDPRFLAPDDGLFAELADEYGDDNVGLAYMQALIRARNEGLPPKRREASILPTGWKPADAAVTDPAMFPPGAVLQTRAAL